MALNKIDDYGGYSWGWKCTHCGVIIDQILTENHWMKEETKQKTRIIEGSAAR